MHALRFPQIVCTISLALMSTCSFAGELVLHTIDSERLAGNLVGEPTAKEIQVFLPDGYDQSNEDYPVMYWFPGARQAPRTGIDIELIDAEFNSGRSVPSIVVFMPGRSSFASSVYMSSEVFGDWEGFLTEEVVPFVDQTYRTTGRRGIAGFSLGGLTATMMPILSPGTFSAVGANDPSIPLISALPRSIDEFPPGYVPGSNGPPLTLEEWFALFPDTIEGLQSTPVVHSGYAQVAARIAPDPDHPLRGLLPFSEEEQWIPEARQQWRDYDLMDPRTVELHRDALEELDSVSLIYPTRETFVNTPWSRELVRVFQQADLPAQGFVSEGGHSDQSQERFNLLLANVSHSLNEHTPLTIGEAPYQQDFDGLGPDLEGPERLPAGWSISDRQAVVQRDRTNSATDEATVPFGPLGVNAGRTGDADRAVGLAINETTAGSTIQLLAEVESDELVNAYRVKFDTVAWASTEDFVESSFVLTAAVDNGAGFSSAVELGAFDFEDGTTEAPTTRARGARQFVTEQTHSTRLLGVPDGDTRTLRLRWATEFEDANSLTLGIDDVTLTPLFLGDFDNDLELTARDFSVLNAAIHEGIAGEQFDLTGDGAVDHSDLTGWITGLYGSLSGDTNLDGRVDVADFLAFSRGFQQPVTDWMNGDFDGDRKTTVRDFLMLSKNFGQAGSVAVPEPSSSVLILGPAACACLSFRRRSRR